MRPNVLALGTLFTLFSLTAGVSAQSAARGVDVRIASGVVDPQPKAPHVDLTLTSQMGASIYQADGAPGGPMAGATALYRHGLVGIGATVVGDHELFGVPGSRLYSGLAGLSWRSDEGVRLDALAAFGWHSYAGFGGTALEPQTQWAGVSGSMPCAGIRLRLAYTFSREPLAHFLLGAEFGYDADLRQQDAMHENVELTMGGPRTTVGLILGITIDIGLKRPRRPRRRRL